ncbi:hypothetical protein ACFLYB_02765 [Chloroflexota bacterium]
MPIAKINYHLSETDATQYTNRKWWGEFQSNKKLKESQLVGTLRMEPDDSRNGECIGWLNSEARSKKPSINTYHFNDRPKINRGNTGGG